MAQRFPIYPYPYPFVCAQESKSKLGSFCSNYRYPKFGKRIGIDIGANMELQGHRGSNNPKAMLSSLLHKREKLQEELGNVEKQAFDGFLSSTKNTSNLKRSRKFQLEDRVFSLSSVTSPAAEELRVVREDGRLDIGQVRSKGGGLASNGQGKPKKGRTGSRDGKKNRLSSDLDLDDEDDLDMR
ncbi:Histone H4 acetyltransferase [Abeliophyllum distichum]|uniref:Histone H4 acetyltransferase n=1 Tax=Abeliophyllum distichum TaxID=126358 RepID=A0ABD1Q290_9LAMI